MSQDMESQRRFPKIDPNASFPLPTGMKGIMPPGDFPLVPEVRTADTELFTRPQDLVNEICRNHFDALHMVDTVRAALEALRTPARRQWGEAVLQGMETYFRATGIVGKVLIPYPSIEGVQADFLALEAALQKAVQIRTPASHFFRSYPGVSTLMQYATEEAEFARKNGRPQDSFLIIAHSRKGMYEYIQGVVNTVEHAEKLSADERLRVPERVVQMLEQGGTKNMPPHTNYYRRTVQGASLAGLVAEEDPQRFIETAMKIIGGAPRGDFSWARILEGILFTAPGKVYVTEHKPLERPTFARNLWRFRQYLVDKLIMPVLTGEAPDEQFDKAFADFFGRLYPTSLVAVMNILVGQLYAGMHYASVLFPDLSQDERIGLSRVAQYVQAKRGHDFSTIERLIAYELFDRSEEVIRSMRERFPIEAGRHYSQLESVGGYARELFYDSDYSAELLQRIEGRRKSGEVDLLKCTGVEFSHAVRREGRAFSMKLQNLLPLDGYVHDNGAVSGVPILVTGQYAEARQLVQEAVAKAYAEWKAAEETDETPQEQAGDKRGVIKSAHKTLSDFLKGFGR